VAPVLSSLKQFRADFDGHAKDAKKPAPAAARPVAAAARPAAKAKEAAPAGD
jgi:hypothetical protein